MKNKAIPFFSLFISLILAVTTTAQPFINEINYFKKLDSLQAPPSRPILFIGSSSFTNWKDVRDYFPSYPILNRAFGGSSLTHQLLYADQVIFAYHPKQIVIYCGENDVASSPTITADSVLNRFKRLHALIRSRLPKVPIVYVSMKPSPSREKFRLVLEKGNQLIKHFIRKKKRTEFVDVYHKMFTKEGTLMEDIFLPDKLHMNKKGYQIWQPLIEPYLLR